MNNRVLIAHHNKDIKWIDEITDNNIDIDVYSTSGNFPDTNRNYNRFFLEQNKGMDSNMYLTYIIKNYDCLPDKTLFIHHHRTDWSQDFDLPFIINNINWNFSDYFSIGSRNHYNQLFNQPNKKDWLIETWFLFDEYIEFPPEIYYYAGTQFMVNKELILQYPLEYYKKLYNWLMTTDYEDGKSGRIFEYTWHYLFTKTPIDRKFEINQILKIK